MPTISYCIKHLDELQPELVEDLFKHPRKNQLRSLARQALAQCLTFFEPNLRQKQLDISADYSAVKEYPLYLCSLTHSEDMALAISAKKEHILSLGVDMEKSTREISEESKRHFINSEDELGDYSLLESWCIKEACFKAIHSLFPECKLLKEVIVKKNSFNFQKKIAPYFSSFYILPNKDKIIVIAMITKEEKKPIFKQL